MNSIIFEYFFNLGRINILNSIYDLGINSQGKKDL